VSAPDEATDRRARGATLRVPFVARCTLRFADGRDELGLIANVNELGAYITADVLPQAGEGLECRFAVPSNPGEIRVTGRVAWVHPRSPRLSGSLPIGFGLQFDPVAEPDRQALERVVRAYLSDTSA